MAVKDVGTNWNRDTRNAIDENDKNLQRQINELVLSSGDSNVEVAQARVDSEGNTYSTLKDRLDDKETKFSSQLAQRPTVQQVDNKLNLINNRLENKRNKTDKIEPEDFSEDALALVTGEGTINLETIPQDGSVTPPKVAEETYKETTIRTSESIIRTSKNIFERSFSSLVDMKLVKNPYYNHFQTNRTSAKDGIFNVNFGGFAFYNVNAVDDLAPGNTFSMLVKAESYNQDSKFEYRQLDGDGQGSIIPFDYLGSGWFGVFGVEILPTTEIIQMRIDARDVTEGGIIFTMPWIVSGDIISNPYAEKEEFEREQRLKETLIPKGYYKENPPEDFSWKDAPINIYSNYRGDFYTDFDVSRMRWTGGLEYFVSKSRGDDNNNGLTSVTPFKTMSKAFEQENIGVIYVEKGLYTRKDLNIPTFDKSIQIIAVEEGVTFSLHDVLNWSKTSGQTNVYQANRSAVRNVYDANHADEFGDYKRYLNVSSLSECDNTPGSWYQEGSIIYVHTIDSRVPDSGIRAYIDVHAINTNGSSDNDVKIYLEGINIEGGRYPFRGNNQYGDVYMYAKNCSFKYGSTLDNVQVIGAKEAFFQNCTAAHSSNDGFNYHIGNGVLPKFIEVNCTGRNNGFQGANNNNGSTAHDGIKGIRVNGTYFLNEGPNIADVDDETEIWMLGVTANRSRATNKSSRRDYHFYGNGGGMKVFMDHCSSFGSPQSLRGTSPDAEIYVRRFDGDGLIETESEIINY